MDMETETAQVKVIAHIRSDFSTKFGIPRQSGLVDELTARIVFTPPFRNEAALRGLEGFSHLWLIWEFSKARRAEWSPPVRPSRPNPIGLSCVRLAGIDLHTPEGPVITVAGADLMDGTPIYDIKPYLPYADCRPEALGGFAPAPAGARLAVDIPPDLLARVPEDKLAALTGVLSQDPRPSYQHDPERVYGMAFAGLEVRFQVEGDRLKVVSVERES